MENLKRAANAKYGFLLENLANISSTDWSEYKLALNTILKLTKWNIDLNKTTKSGHNIMQCLFDKASTITFESVSFDLQKFASQCKEVCKYIEHFTLLGARFNITSEHGANSLQNMENYMRESTIISYKTARVKYLKKDPTAKKMLKIVHKNGWAQKDTSFKLYERLF